MDHMEIIKKTFKTICHHLVQAGVPLQVRLCQGPAKAGPHCSHLQSELIPGSGSAVQLPSGAGSRFIKTRFAKLKLLIVHNLI